MRKRDLQTGRNRFVKLIDYLKANQFGMWNMMNFRYCAASHLPTIFPKLWKFDRDGYPTLVGSKALCTTTQLSDFFHVPSSEFGVNDDRGNLVFANNFNQKDQIKAMKKFLKDYYDKKLTSKE